MPALVESMFYTSNEENGRFVPWHGLGTAVEEALTSEEALKIAGLDWEVEKKPIFNENGIQIPKYFRTSRSSDNSTLGIVSGRYSIVQNREAFSFTDELVAGDARYETAGSLNDGRRVWLLAKLPEKYILDDKFDTYICFTNTHDGTGSVKVCMTPIRVVCNNTLNLALSQTRRKWSTRHIGNLDAKLEEARNVLQMANAYMEELNEQAQVLSEVKLTEGDVEVMFDSIFPVDYNKDTARKISNVEYLKNAFFQCLKAPDISQFSGTAWGAINAMTDFVDHTKPIRVTESYQENNWGKIMEGHPAVDMMYSLITSKIGG